MQCGDAIHARHADVAEDHVHRLQLQRVKQVLSILRLEGDFEAKTFDQGAQSGTNQGLVVGQGHPQGP